MNKINPLQGVLSDRDCVECYCIICDKQEPRWVLRVRSPSLNVILGCAGDGISLGHFGHILYLENKNFDSIFLEKTVVSKCDRRVNDHQKQRLESELLLCPGRAPLVFNSAGQALL